MDQTEEMKEVDVDTTIAVEMAMDPTMVGEEDITAATFAIGAMKVVNNGRILMKDAIVDEEIKE